MTVYTLASLFSLTRASDRELGAGVSGAGRAAFLPLTGGSSFAHRASWPWLALCLWTWLVLGCGSGSPAQRVLFSGEPALGGRGNRAVKLLADAECGVRLQGHPAGVLPPPWAGIESPDPLGSSGPAEPLAEVTVGMAVGAASVLGAAVRPRSMCEHVQPSEWHPLSPFTGGESNGHRGQTC